MSLKSVEKQEFVPGQLVGLNPAGIWEAENYDGFTVVTGIKKQNPGEEGSTEFHAIGKNDILLIIRKEYGTGVYLALVGDVLVYITDHYFKVLHD